MISWDRKDAWIAVFDILGFKEMIRQADRDLPRVLLTDRLEELIRVLDSKPAEPTVKYSILSDTFVVWTSDLEPRSYPWFLRKCKNLITRSIYVELPIRGAISAGPVFFSINPTIVIGSSFLEAYEYCESQDWIGLLLTPSATQLLRKNHLEPLHHDFVSDNLPLREKPINNVLAYRFQNGCANFKSPLLPHLNQMKHRAPQKAKLKYQNTVSFIEKHYRLIEPTFAQETL